LTLAEVLVATAIFAMLSLSFYFLLRSGLRIRQAVSSDTGALTDMYMAGERLAHEIRNRIVFRSGDSGMLGDECELTMITPVVPSAGGGEVVRRVTYRFEDQVLMKYVRDPFSDEDVEPVPFLTGLDRVTFSYFDASRDEWIQVWENKAVPPAGVRIGFGYRDRDRRERNIDRYVHFYDVRAL